MKIKKNDLFIGIYLLAAVLFFIISIPSWLLDILLAINILVALVVLFNSLFAKEVLDMASFPTMLLFTTIFRISLNVSSTKLILKNGYAGKVVDTFGKFVGSGNLVIGIIIFIILIIIISSPPVLLIPRRFTTFDEVLSTTTFTTVGYITYTDNWIYILG